MASICPTCGQPYPDRVGYCANDGTKLVAQQAIATASGSLLDGRFEVRERIGEGALGAVYRGFQLSVSREVAIKILRPAFAADPAATQLLFAAVQRACQLIRPSVVTTLDCGYSGEAIYIVSELVRGHSLAELLAPQKGLGARRAAAFAHQICDALAAAHAQGIVHGDLKPANVLAANDALKVGDFGFARALVRDPWSVDPRLAQYTAPELDAGVAPTVASDLYALGCILYELLAGKPAFTGASARQIVERHRTEPPPRLPRDVPYALAAVVERLLAKPPEARYASAAAVLAELKPLVPDAPETAVPAPVAAPPADDAAPHWQASTTTSRTQPVPPMAYARPRSSMRVLVIAAVAVLASLVAIAIYMFA